MPDSNGIRQKRGQRIIIMFGISTSWNCERHGDAGSMIKEIKAIGVDAVELNFKLSKEMVDGVGRLVDKDVIKVLSLHNFCPVPESIEISKASPDYYSLASLDEGEREKAVSETKRTMDTAYRLKAKAVVIHAGRLDIKDRTRELARTIEEGIAPEALIALMQEEREAALKKGYLDCLLKSIKDLLLYSKKSGVRIGLENRFYFRELPSIADFDAIFTAFRDPNVCYWHDTGHAQVYENLRLLRHEDYLERFAHRLLGVHLHDVKGVIDDHNAPFTGDFDFAILKPFLNKDVIKILEPHAPATAEDIKTAVHRLKGLYGE